MRSRTVIRSAALGASAAALLLVACSPVTSREDRLAARQIRQNPTPAMADANDRGVDLQNQRAYVIDTNLRLMREDLQEFWLLDRPSRMSDFAAPY